MESPNLIDLFCGCGGFSQGFRDSGYNVLLGIDIWEDALQTFKYNIPESKTKLGDITEISPDVIKHHISNIPVDIIIGGPPCQGFSLSGKRLIDDPRNKLYKTFVEYVKFFKPKAFVMENVPGMIKLFNGKIKNQILEDFTEAGYNVQVEILSSEEYGVPQKRKRAFFIGTISNIKTGNFFPLPTHGIGRKKIVTTRDALSDIDNISDSVALPNVSDYLTQPETEYQEYIRDNSVKLVNHVITIHKASTKDIIALVPDGGNYKDLPKHLQSTRKVNIAWTRMNSNEPCFTIDTGHNHHFHYRANRVPTVRESARIQSFKDTFIFQATKTSQLKQVGNAVPPLVAKAIADNLIKFFM